MTGVKTDNKRVRAIKILNKLKELFPNAKVALNYGNNWELLVTVILSAQCTDKMVNKVTPGLFEKYKTLADYVSADSGEFEKYIKPTGFYKNKTKNILAAAQKIQNDFGGKLPRTMEKMLTIPGVARKTANVVLGNAYGVVEGMAVDTHIKRFAQKFNLTDYKDPVRIERNLMDLFPKKEWFPTTYRLIEYGRQICPARKHDCAKHPLSVIYPPAADKWPKAK
jgi:endonuclease III